MSIFTFNKTYFILSILLFSIEVIIALYVRDNFIRPYLGDVLVVMLVYCFIKAFLRLPVMSAAIVTLLFAFGVEMLQLIDIVGRLGIDRRSVAGIVIGSSFSWGDLAAYVVGIGAVLLIEGRKRHQ